MVSVMRELTIKIPNVSESLEDKLEDLILGGAFWPDEALAPERRLAVEFDVSRTSIRNALKNLTGKGLLSIRNRKYHVTNVLDDLLCPELAKIAQEAPQALMEYWLLLFCDAVNLARRKARNSDKTKLLAAVRNLKQRVVAEKVSDASVAFEHLTRVVFDSCYNFFLSQTHHALFEVAGPLFTVCIEELCAQLNAEGRKFDDLDAVADYRADFDVWFSLLAVDLCDFGRASVVTREAWESSDPKKLIEVVLRHNVALEAIYELRLITETHAADFAARCITVDGALLLRQHLERMTVAVDTAPEAYSDLDTELHELIACNAQNPVFPVIDRTFAPVFSRTTNHWLQQHLQIQSDQSMIHHQHTEIVAEICEKHPERAKSAMKEHLAYVLRNLRYLREQDYLHEIATARRLLAH